jgi:hypothetical protein
VTHILHRFPRNRQSDTKIISAFAAAYHRADRLRGRAHEQIMTVVVESRVPTGSCIVDGMIDSAISRAGEPSVERQDAKVFAETA